MILPIEASMHTPRHFDLALSGTMAAVTALYVAFGAVPPPPPPSPPLRARVIDILPEAPAPAIVRCNDLQAEVGWCASELACDFIALLQSQNSAARADFATRGTISSLFRTVNVTSQHWKPSRPKCSA